jgi:hypothetical protein
MIFYTNTFFLSPWHHTPGPKIFLFSERKESCEKIFMHSIYILINSHVRTHRKKRSKNSFSLTKKRMFHRRETFLHSPKRDNDSLSRCLHFFVFFLSRRLFSHVMFLELKRPLFCALFYPFSRILRSLTILLRDKLIAMPKLVKANTEVSCFMQEANNSRRRKKVLKH